MEGDEHTGEHTGEQISGFCPRFHRAIEIIGRRWTGVIVRALLAGDTRFCQIRTTIPGLSDRLLSERLKELEAEGIVERRVYTGTPVRIEYHLTPKGEALADVVQSASTWAEEWVVPDELADGHEPAAAHKAS
jgi:DNA-binding HxlR family transcriptional regulator